MVINMKFWLRLTGRETPHIHSFLCWSGWHAQRLHVWGLKIGMYIGRIHSAITWVPINFLRCSAPIGLEESKPNGSPRISVWNFFLVCVCLYVPVRCRWVSESRELFVGHVRIKNPPFSVCAHHQSLSQNPMLSLLFFHLIQYTLPSL